MDLALVVRRDAVGELVLGIVLQAGVVEFSLGSEAQYLREPLSCLSVPGVVVGGVDAALAVTGNAHRPHGVADAGIEGVEVDIEQLGPVRQNSLMRLSQK